ncbi:MAG: 3-oxoacyl-[acyl-carrier-protein] synthase III C-terminal domain-containing protein [Chlamydiota bacterium]|jgi:predicted naringenin-chalcone synthase
MSCIALSDFKSKKPKYELEQDKILQWLALAHTYAEAKTNKITLFSEKFHAFRQEIQEKFLHVGCSSEHINKRGFSLPDYLHNNWHEMEVFCLHESSQGENIQKRSKLFEKIADEAFDFFYPTSSNPPDGMIHVSCTGYVAPSSAQKKASFHKWLNATHVTHAYHMGCYASIPAIRIATGYAYSPLSKGKNRIDIIHTEVSSVHTNPLIHEADELVAQSLFADGFIKYSISNTQPTHKPYLQVLSLHESLIENSSKYMGWNLTPWGFKISLGKEIPVLISKNIHFFLNELAKSVNKKTSDLLENAIFAIHPGGPKIIAQIQKQLNLQNSQLAASRAVLKKRGNMSSATLPHIWQEILDSSDYPDQTLIVSLAFGPGLSICGTVFKKEC